MSIELATAYVTLIPSLRGAKGRIESELGGVDTDSASRKIGRGLGDGIGRHLDTSAISSKLSSVSASLMGVGSGMTLGITAPVITATGAVGKFAIETASAAETTEISFTTMLGSAEAAEQMMGDLSDFAAKTPFELSGLQTATRQLLAYGFTSEEVIPMLTAVGDATSALGTGQAGIESVTRALGQMQTRGKVSAEEMLQLTEAGVPAWEYLARAIGTDTAGAMEAVSSGAEDAQTGIDALTAGMEQDFGGMMEQQSQTVAGLFSNLSDAIERPLMELRDTEAYDRFAEAVSGVVDSAGPFVESLLPHMENGLDVVSDVLGKATDAMDGFAEMGFEGQESIIKTVAAAAGAGPALTVLGGGLKVASVAMGGIGNAAGAAKSAFKKLADAASSAAPAATAAATGTAAMQPAATAAAGGTKKFTTALKGLKVGLATTGIGAVLVVVGELVSAFQQAQEHAELVGDATMTFGDISAAAGDKLEGLKADADGVLESMSALNESAVDTVADFETQETMLDGYLATIEELAGQGELTASEQERLRQAVEGYNDITGESVEIIDEQNGMLSTSTDELKKNADAWLDQAEAQAYSQLAADYLEEQLNAERELEQAYKDREEAYEELYALQNDQMMGGALDLIDAAQRVHDTEQAVSDLEDTVQTAGDNWAYFSSQGAIAASQLDDAIQAELEGLPVEMQAAGLDIASGLSAGIESGAVTVDGAAQFISEGLNGVVAQLPESMRLAGNAAATTLAAGISSGQISVQDAVTVLKAVVGGDISTLPEELRPWGEQAAASFGLGIQDGATGVEASATEVAQAAAGMADAGDLYTSGWHLVSNFAAGIEGARGLVSSAADAITSALSSIQFSIPKTGPFSGAAKGGYTFGLHLGQNFAEGMVAGSSYVAEAADKMALAAIPGTGAGGFSSGQMSRTDAILAELLDSLPRMIRDNSPSSMTVNGREFARAVREVVPA